MAAQAAGSDEEITDLALPETSLAQLYYISRKVSVPYTIICGLLEWRLAALV